MVRPSDQYKMSDQCIDWRNNQQIESSGKLCVPLCDSSKKPIILSCDSVINEKNKFYIKVKRDSKQVYFEDTNATNDNSILYQIKLMPIVKLKNFLPYKISYAFEGIDQLFYIEMGEESDLSHIRLGETGFVLLISISNFFSKL
jgi:hypothetical protein